MTEFTEGIKFRNTEIDLPSGITCKLSGSYFCSLDVDDSKFAKELHDLMLKYKVSRIDMSLDPFSLLKECLNAQ